MMAAFPSCARIGRGKGEWTHWLLLVRVTSGATYRSEHVVVHPPGNCSDRGDLESLQVHLPQGPWVVLGDVRVCAVGSDRDARGATEGGARACSI